jgi:hypothetical protein
MANTSATGGYLTPNPTPVVTEDQALRQLIHGVIQGVTGLAADRVRQAWQPTPAPVLPLETNWGAFAIMVQRGDFDPYTIENDIGTFESMTRNEEVEILCTFYGPNCQANASYLRDGMAISQNNDVLFSVGAAVVGFGDIIHAPELVNDRFVDRADITMTLRRQIVRSYPILSFLAAQGTIYSETLSEPWVVDPQGVIP